jgi:DNA-binding transcriptional MerR regulator
VQTLFDPPSNRRQAKSAAAFRTISEVSEELAVPQHVLRFWESKFAQIRPLKRGGGRRYYRPEDVTLLRRIRQCLYEDGYTIRGVQRLLREGQLKPADTALPSAEPEVPPAAEPNADPSESDDPRRELLEIRAELMRLRDLLRKAGS